jgi:hypothetical protein
MSRFLRMAVVWGIAGLLLAFGFLAAAAGYQTIRKWPSIGAAYAAYGLLWIVAGPAMFASGLWLLRSLVPSRVPLWIGGGAALLCGASLIVGVLTYVVPCTGPS